MKHNLFALALFAITSAAHADDTWTGPDKKLHLGAGIVIGAVGTLATGSRMAGFALGAGAGLLKEVYDDHYRDIHTVSAKDFAVTALGAAIGAQLPGLLIGPRSISYTTSF